MSRINTGRLIREIFCIFRQSYTALLGWLLGYPLTYIVRRDPHATVVMGRRGPVFADNSKYYFISASQAIRDNEHIVFLAGETTIATEIEAVGGDVLLHPTWRSLLAVLRCGRIVVDMADWIDYGVYPLSRGAQTIQLWHGAPLKHIELDLYRKRLGKLPFGMRTLLMWQKSLIGRYPIYDVVAATSQAFIDHAFTRSFTAIKYLATGYPRNDILLEQPRRNSLSYKLVQINIDSVAVESARLARSNDQKIALYVPTFRQGMDSPFDESLDAARLSTFAARHNLVIFIKLHPCMHASEDINQSPNLMQCAPLSDIYPLMAQCDLLITDYSSIYLDFLLLDRPIIFFAYDLEEYVDRDRSLYFPYESMTPGNRCGTQAELEYTLTTILGAGCQDDFSEQRAAVRRFTHDNTGPGAVARLLANIN